MLFAPFLKEWKEKAINKVACCKFPNMCDLVFVKKEFFIEYILFACLLLLALGIPPSFIKSEKAETFRHSVFKPAEKKSHSFFCSWLFLYESCKFWSTHEEKSSFSCPTQFSNEVSFTTKVHCGLWGIMYTPRALYFTLERNLCALTRVLLHKCVAVGLIQKRRY